MSIWRERRQIRLVRGCITAVLTLLLIGVLALFVCTVLLPSRQPAETEACVPAATPVPAELPFSQPPRQIALLRDAALPVMPVAGTVTSRFGVRTDPFSGEPDFHPALDIAAPEGSEVRAAMAGVVSQTGYSRIYGSYLRVWHGDGLETRYGHCSALLAETGQAVEAGEVIGLVGHTGRATGSHLDFQVWQDGEPVDPAGWLGE